MLGGRGGGGWEGVEAELRGWRDDFIVKMHT